MKTLKYISFLFFSIVPLFSVAQIQYEAYGEFGFSRLNETDWEEQAIIANSYSHAPSYAIGFLAVKSIKDDLFKIKAGLEIESLATKVGIKDRFNDPEINTDDFPETLRFHSIGVPISFSYAFEKWLYLNVGVDNKYLFDKPKNSTYNNYTFGLHGGFDFVLYKKYSIGLNYNRDMTPFWKLNNLEIYYHSDQISLKLSYSID